jgi:hypothetical protein
VDKWVGNNSGDDKELGGRLAWLAIWNRQLSYNELLAQQYNPHVTQGCVLFCHYGLYNLGTQLDLSGAGNHGQVTGATVAGHVPLDSLGSRNGVIPQRIVPAYPKYTAKRV